MPLLAPAWTGRAAALAVLAALGLASATAQSAEDAATPAPPFQTGDGIGWKEIQKLQPYLPEEFWSNRDFFYEGMQLESGRFDYDYSPSKEYLAATERYRGQPRIGPDNSLENYTAGQPFPIGEIDCAAGAGSSRRSTPSPSTRRTSPGRSSRTISAGARTPRSPASGSRAGRGCRIPVRSW